MRIVPVMIIILCTLLLCFEISWAGDSRLDPYIIGSMLFRTPGSCCDFSLQLGVRVPVEGKFFFATAAGVGITERGNSSVHLSGDVVYQLPWHSVMVGVGPYLEVLSYDGFTSYEHTWNARFSGYAWKFYDNFSLGAQILFGQHHEYVIIHLQTRVVGELIKSFSFSGGVFALYDF
ncbi:MAG TPA: hypothetical protein VJA22_01010 [Patescibacteria group bacterium]|nr:hypothetical protein [Patescibacteria group bacterium]